jgi:hypothetical protein
MGTTLYDFVVELEPKPELVVPETLVVELDAKPDLELMVLEILVDLGLELLKARLADDD